MNLFYGKNWSTKPTLFVFLQAWQVLVFFVEEHLAVAAVESQTEATVVVS